MLLTSSLPHTEDEIVTLCEKCEAATLLESSQSFIRQAIAEVPPTLKGRLALIEAALDKVREEVIHTRLEGTVIQ